MHSSEGIHSCLARAASCIALVALLTGCAGITVSSVERRTYVAGMRGDVLSTGRLSTPTAQSLRMLGLDAATCDLEGVRCREAIERSSLLDDERKLSALAELWLQRALRLTRAGPDQVHPDAIRDAHLETVRYAYAYLFFTARRPQQRAFEDRQIQVLDYYNFAVKDAIGLIFPRYRGRPPVSPALLTEGRWRIHLALEVGRPSGQRRLPKELVAASSLRFDGLRNVYRRDGFGAEMVAVLEPDESSDSAQPFTPMEVPTITAIIRFRGDTLDEVLRTRDIDLVAFDPYRYETVELGGVDVPLAANFTAGYALWLARSGFSRRALRGVLGRTGGVAAPHVYLMQPYDPDRHVVITLHGLASSPLAWLNVANEVLGDEALRRRFQVWQVVYPTNAPIAFNHRHVRAAIEATLAHFDPTGSALASRGIVVVGHSMGGVLARLMVSSSGDQVESAFIEDAALEGAPLDRVIAEFGPYLAFEPMPEVTRAVFIAAPHRGTPFANRPLSRWAASLVLLPYDVLDTLTDINRSLAAIGADQPGSVSLRVPNSIENLSDRSLFLRLADTMPISTNVEYHSIIANNTPHRPLENSNDGVVPFRSAHLPGAASETVIESWHSVQETPEAILELRRILRTHAPPR
jgi:pimeloyl-ACP methyl ester carboxylesterase